MNGIHHQKGNCKDKFLPGGRRGGRWGGWWSSQRAPATSSWSWWSLITLMIVIDKCKADLKGYADHVEGTEEQADGGHQELHSLLLKGKFIILHHSKRSQWWDLLHLDPIWNLYFELKLSFLHLLVGRLLIGGVPGAKEKIHLWAHFWKCKMCKMWIMNCVRTNCCQWWHCGSGRGWGRWGSWRRRPASRCNRSWWFFFTANTALKVTSFGEKSPQWGDF